MHSVIPSQNDSPVHTNTILQSLMTSQEINNSLIYPENYTKAIRRLLCQLPVTVLINDKGTELIMKMNAGTRHHFDQLC